MQHIMAFGDIHEYIHGLPELAEVMCQADLILVSGDITRWRGPETADKVIQAIREYNPTILAQIGNTDTWETHHYLDSLGMNLHGQGYRFGDVGIFGVGGSNPTPFYTPSEFTEKEITDFLMAGYAMVKDAPYTILVAHCPPSHTTVDRIYSGYHVGSTSVRQFIEAYQPTICISGHIHEASGEDYLGATHILNPGMLAQGGYITVQANDTGVTAQRMPGRDRRHYSTSPFLPPSL